MKSIDLSQIKWGINGNKLLISPKFTKYINALAPGIDKRLMISLFSLVHFVSTTIDKTEPNKMKASQYQPAVHIGSPINRHKGKISSKGLKEFTRVLSKKYSEIKGSKDYQSLMTLANMSNNPIGKRPIEYKLDHTKVPVGSCLIDLNNHCKIIQKITTFAYMNHYQITFKMNTGEVGAGCLDLPSKPKKE